MIQMGHDGENINEELIRKIASMTGDSLEFLRDRAGVDISFPVRETLAHNTVSYLVSTKKSVVLGEMCIRDRSHAKWFGHREADSWKLS